MGSNPTASAIHGEMSEWLKEPVSKIGVLKSTVGSNPTLSSTNSPECRNWQTKGTSNIYNGSAIV